MTTSEPLSKRMPAPFLSFTWAPENSRFSTITTAPLVTIMIALPLGIGATRVLQVRLAVDPDDTQVVLDHGEVVLVGARLDEDRVAGLGSQNRARHRGRKACRCRPKARARKRNEWHESIRPSLGSRKNIRLPVAQLPCLYSGLINRAGYSPERLLKPSLNGDCDRRRSQPRARVARRRGEYTLVRLGLSSKKITGFLPVYCARCPFMFSPIS